ncbi:MAG TPA: aspartyl/asparaginyl beta-hydroxylase domain-containing protein [Pyrinomonadaceae bacterium]|nr:aspartyl/asparaginyl beta-hydroxylase domain-containing protein [Pyrinomonadaceae bacterium]
MIPTLKLPFRFDPVALKNDLRGFSEADWTPHFNTQYYEGDWSGIALRAAANAHVGLYPDPTAEKFEDTPALEKCPAVRDVLKGFECETESVRFLRLGAGAKIRRHRDHKLSVDDGVARVHVPIKTSPFVEFYLDDKRVEMGEGEAWYLNFNLYHAVENHGTDERIHLVIDCIVNDWFQSFFTPSSSDRANES